MRFKEYGQYDGMGLAELVRNGDVSATELLDEAIGREARVNPAINAIIQPLHEMARQAIQAGLPNGPFSGVPFLVKDLLAAVAGQPMRNGSRFFKDYISPADSNLVKRYKAAGLNIFGKTNTPEFGVTPITDPELFGSSLNPWGLDYSPAGSSGGSAAAVAAKIVPMANGGDGGGSIRCPSAACGLVGMKPTRGRNPSGPMMGDFWYGMAVEHVLTRSVRDSAAMMDATAGPDVGPPNYVPVPAQSFYSSSQQDPGKLRIGYSLDPGMGRSLDPECVAAVERTVQQLIDLGHDVEEATPAFNREDMIYNMAIMVAGDTAATIKEAEQVIGRKATRQDFELATWGFKKIGQAFSAADFASAYWFTQRLGRMMGEYHEKYDIYLTATQGRPQPKPGDLKATGIDRLALETIARLPVGKIGTKREIVIQAAEKVYDFMSLTALANMTGQPSISLPQQKTSNGMPVGVLFTAKFGDEATLYSLAGQIERAHPWANRKPAINADNES